MPTRILPLKIPQHQRHVRRQPSITQRRRRTAFKDAARRWHDDLTDADRLSWIRPEFHPLTAYQLYMKFNVIRRFNSLPIWTQFPKI